MSRSRWKGPFICLNILKNIKKYKKKPQHTIKTLSRYSEIIPKFVGKNFEIYNGKKFSNVKITEEMIGYKLGEFSTTRKKFSFKKKRRNKNFKYGSKNKSEYF